MNEESTRIRKLARAKLQAIRQGGQRTTRKSGKASCGATFGSVDEWFAHQTRNHSCSYTVVPNYKTVHHDAAGHYEDQGHYETVTTGYACSGCGAAE